MITVETLGSSSKGNCYVLRSGGRSLLLECGLPWKEIRKKLNFQTTDLDGCLVTHSHKDHCRAAADVMAAGIDLYCTEETFSGMVIKRNYHRLLPFTFGKRYGVTYQPEKGDVWEFQAFETVHDAPGSCGFVVFRGGESLLFLTDTAYCKYRFQGLSILMIEANFSESILQRNVDAGLIDSARAKRVRGNHMSIERVIDFLKANDLSRCREIMLIHLSDGNSNAELFKRMVQEQTGIITTIAGE